MGDDLKQTDMRYGLAVGFELEGRYEILGELGEGGFAMVYRARQLNIQRDVAIKVLNPSPDPRQAASFEERFLREARTAAQISHPNVVNIFDFGIIPETRQPFIAMELLQGHDMDEALIEHGPMSPQRLLPLFVEALEALGEAHKLGIVHKDLKPSNLFIINPGTRREAIKVVDFGIARVHDPSQARLTGTGQILGTPQYLAPEYIMNQSASAAVDVYQMGLILVELLTGKPVVDFDSPYQCLMVHGSGQLEVPEGFLAGPLGPVILKALELEPERRYPDAEAFAEALAAINPDHIEPTARNTTTRRLGDVSTSLRAVAVTGAPSTGNFIQPVAMPRPTQRRDAPTLHETPVMAPEVNTSEPDQAQITPSPSRTPLLKIAALVCVALLLAAGLVVGAAIAFSDTEAPTKAPEVTSPTPEIVAPPAEEAVEAPVEVVPPKKAEPEVPPAAAVEEATVEDNPKVEDKPERTANKPSGRTRQPRKPREVTREDKKVEEKKIEEKKVEEKRVMGFVDDEPSDKGAKEKKEQTFEFLDDEKKP